MNNKLGTTTSQELLSDELINEIKNLNFRANYAYDIDLMLNILRNFFSVVEPSAYPQFNEAMVKALHLMKTTAFEGVDPEVRQSTIPSDLFSKYEDGYALHLELGTWTAWPEDVTERYIQEHNLGDVCRLDMQIEFKPDVAASVTALPFADESIDRISSRSLFEHCPYPHEILKEAFRVLRPGGAILTSVPFIFVQHSCPDDYLRFTESFFRQVCQDIGFSNVYTDSMATSGVYYTAHQLIKGSIFNREAFLGESGEKIHTAIMLLLSVFQGLDMLFHAHGASFWHTTTALAIKPGEYIPRNDIFDRSLPFYKRFLNNMICPNSGLPLRSNEDSLVSLDNSYSYSITNNVPNLFCMHGFGSSITHKASSRRQYNKWIENFKDKSTE